MSVNDPDPTLADKFDTPTFPDCDCANAEALVRVPETAVVPEMPFKYIVLLLAIPCFPLQ